MFEFQNSGLTVYITFLWQPIWRISEFFTLILYIRIKTFRKERQWYLHTENQGLRKGAKYLYSKDVEQKAKSGISGTRGAVEAVFKKAAKQRYRATYWKMLKWRCSRATALLKALKEIKAAHEDVLFFDTQRNVSSPRRG